jgi:phage repressor protein C with HTH and peptisase S24 domain
VLKLARVAGTSMAPTLRDGDFVIALRAPWGGRPRQGDIVLGEHAELGLIIKRVVEVHGDGRLSLAGDNPLSRESTRLGSIAESAVCGRVWLRVTRGSRLIVLCSRGPRQPRH